MMHKTIETYRHHAGFTLIELIVVILTVAILATIAVQKMAPLGRSVRIEETKREMDRLAIAIAGNPDVHTAGFRTAFGYIGDVGSLPPDLDALYANPGYATWNGPYIDNAFAQQPDDFKKDAWQRDYIYAGISIISLGSGEAIEKRLAASAGHLLGNSISGNLVDIDGTPPGYDYADSLSVRLFVPDGVGGITARTSGVDAGGHFAFDSIPIGNHRMEIMYQPGSDTLRRFVSVPPNSRAYGEYYFSRDLWPEGGAAGGIEFVAGSDTLLPWSCSRLTFWIINTGSAPIAVSSLTATWPTPTAYYRRVSWNGIAVRDGNPALGSGDTAVFGSMRSINPGESVQIRIESFRRNPGGGPAVDMTGAEFGLDFSDGSTITFRADLCAE